MERGRRREEHDGMVAECGSVGVNECGHYGGGGDRDGDRYRDRYRDSIPCY